MLFLHFFINASNDCDQMGHSAPIHPFMRQLSKEAFADPYLGLNDEKMQKALGPCPSDFHGYYMLIKEYYEELSSHENCIQSTQSFRKIVTFLYDCLKFDFDDSHAEPNLTASWNEIWSLLKQDSNLKLKIFNICGGNLTLIQWFRQQLLNLDLAYSYAVYGSILPHIHKDGPVNLSRTFLSPFIPVSLQHTIMKCLFSESKDEIIKTIELINQHAYFDPLDFILLDLGPQVRAFLDLSDDLMSLENKIHSLLKRLGLLTTSSQLLRAELLEVSEIAYRASHLQTISPQLRGSLIKTLFSHAKDGDMLAQLYCAIRKKHKRFNGHVILNHLQISAIREVDNLKELGRYLANSTDPLEQSKYQTIKMVLASKGATGCIIA
jgi:hypothetical protein